MLGVLPFVEDPDLSCSAAAALPQQQKRIVCWFFGFHICTTYYSLAAENNTLLGLNRTGTKYLCQNRIPYSCLSNSDSSTASTGYLTDSNFHFLNKSAQEKILLLIFLTVVTGVPVLAVAKDKSRISRLRKNIWFLSCSTPLETHLYTYTWISLFSHQFFLQPSLMSQLLTNPIGDEYKSAPSFCVLWFDEILCFIKSSR